MEKFLRPAPRPERLGPSRSKPGNRPGLSPWSLSSHLRPRPCSTGMPTAASPLFFPALFTKSVSLPWLSSLQGSPWAGPSPPPHPAPRVAGQNDRRDPGRPLSKKKKILRRGLRLTAPAPCSRSAFLTNLPPGPLAPRGPLPSSTSRTSRSAIPIACPATTSNRVPGFVFRVCFFSTGFGPGSESELGPAGG